MKFEKVALIGCGLMGGSFALAAREAGWAQHIVGYSASASSRQKALSMGVIDASEDSIAQAVQGADLVLLAVPVTATSACFEADIRKTEITAKHVFLTKKDFPFIINIYINHKNTN